MVLRSCTSLVDLGCGNLLDMPQTPRPLSPLISVPGVNDDSDTSTWVCHEKKIIVANFLPLHAHKDMKSGKWSFNFDEDALLLQMKDGFLPDTDVFYVGSLKAEVDMNEQEEVAVKLLEDFHCIPTFLSADLHQKFYHGFCKQYLWPLFHYMLPLWPHYCNQFDRSHWQAYVSANKIFADKIMEVINPEYDYVWIHDYHLMILPTFLRKRFARIKLGFFLHSPFPSSEIYRSLPVRDEILKAFLNADLVGFHTFDYARHFLSCCSRMLGIDYESKRGYIGLEYFGRTVYIKILPVGVHMGRIEYTLNLESTSLKVNELKDEFMGKKLVIGVDDMDIFKGISLKLLAVEQLLHQHPEFHGKLVLIQIINPARSCGKDVQEARRDAYTTAHRINKSFGSVGYRPVVLIDQPISHYEKSAYYALSDCCMVNAVRDGMNLTPYEYIVCRQGTPSLNGLTAASSPRTSMLIISEFIGCSPSLSGAVRVNPWDIDAVADAINVALTMPEAEKQLRHEKHYRYVSSHDVAYWASSFMQDLERACKDHYSKRCWSIGFGLGFRIISLSPNFRKLSVTHIVSAYTRSKRRAIFLDYDGTIVPHASIVKAPTSDVVSVLDNLSNDPRNTVFIVSGRGKNPLSEWFSSCENLGIAAEHGFFIRNSGASSWEKNSVCTDFDWKRVAEPVMRLYAETTDGSYIEIKESALVWHHKDSDPDFGSCQAMELLDHLENVLSNEPVVVTRGQQIVEIKPQCVSKGLVAGKIISTMINSGSPPDFVMCIGDDRSDEDMFERISSIALESLLPTSPEIFACTVGQKPSKARYYLDDTTDVVKLLQGLEAASKMKTRCAAEIQLSVGNSTCNASTQIG